MMIEKGKAYEVEYHFDDKPEMVEEWGDRIGVVVVADDEISDLSDNADRGGEALYELDQLLQARFGVYDGDVLFYCQPDKDELTEEEFIEEMKEDDIIVVNVIGEREA